MARNKLFTKVEMANLPRNFFDLSHDHKTSCKMGELVPVMCIPTIPGDRFNVETESMLRFAPLVAPVMHRMKVSFHTFFVPKRILWDNYEEYYTGGDGLTEPPQFPYLRLNKDNAGHWTKLVDYLGIPNPANIPGSSGIERVSAMPFAVYQAIYNEYYRDENLIKDYTNDLWNNEEGLEDGENNTTIAKLIKLRYRAWDHDYFTSCLPFAQKGQPVSIPLGSQTVVLEDGNFNMQLLRKASDHGLYGTGDIQANSNSEIYTPDGLNQPAVIDPNSTLITEDTGQSTTIEDLRRATKLQEFLERVARAGSRMAEFIKGMFGVQSSDKRLQRPEYITGSVSPVVISEVLNTTGTEEAPQGNMAGHGVSITNGVNGSFFCEEPGYIMTIMSVTPDTAYMQGIPKDFLKINNRYEEYFEQFAHIGEQEVLRKELYAFQGETDETLFGYIPRYSEYKFENNRTSGDFRTTLDFWTVTRDFASAPALNKTFIECVPTTRIFAVEDGSDYLWCHVFNKVKATRPMAYYGNPKFT